jgi:hypothetical protein
MEGKRRKTGVGTIRVGRGKRQVLRLCECGQHTRVVESISNVSTGRVRV